MISPTGFPTQVKYMDYCMHKNHPDIYKEPKILQLIDGFLSRGEIEQYQKTVCQNWTPGPSISDVRYFSKDLYNHYQWNGDWTKVGWLDSTSPEWENLYHKISALLPKHRVHWADLKLTPPMCSGTLLHRDKDPWNHDQTHQEFSHAVSVICNLNLEWKPEWGGSTVVYEAYKTSTDTVRTVEKQKLPLSAGQLLIFENCWHSIDPIVQSNRSRFSFILHVLVYK